MGVQPETYPIGSSVRVIQGCFTGLAGVIVRVTDGNIDCLLKIENWQVGAYLKIKSDALALHDTAAVPNIAGVHIRDVL